VLPGNRGDFLKSVQPIGVYSRGQLSVVTACLCMHVRARGGVCVCVCVHACARVCGWLVYAAVEVPGGVVGGTAEKRRRSYPAWGR